MKLTLETFTDLQNKVSSLTKKIGIAEMALLSSKCECEYSNEKNNFMGDAMKKECARCIGLNMLRIPDNHAYIGENQNLYPRRR